MTAFIEPARLLELSEAFDLYDPDGSGSISVAHVPRLLKSLGVVVPDAALAQLLFNFTQATAEAHRQQHLAEPRKPRVALAPNDDFASCLATAEPGAGPALERDDNGVAHPQLTGKVRVEKLSITLEELLTLLGSRGAAAEQRERETARERSMALQMALQLYDVNKNGTVAVADLRKALRVAVGTKDVVSDAEIERIVDVADPDRTGVVDYEALTDQLFA
jgi:Ca2+-binding EF-hand superfamily protein